MSANAQGSCQCVAAPVGDTARHQECRCRRAGDSLYGRDVGRVLRQELGREAHADFVAAIANACRQEAVLQRMGGSEQTGK